MFEGLMVEYLEEVAIIVSVVIFFLRLERKIDTLAESMKMADTSGATLAAAVTHLSATLDRISERSAREHREITEALVRIDTRLTIHTERDKI